MNQAEIKRVAEQTRQRLLDYMADKSRDLYQVLDGAAGNIDRAAVAVAEDNKINSARLGYIFAAIAGMMVGLRPRLSAIIIGAMRKGIDLGMIQAILSSTDKEANQVGTSYIGVDGEVRRYDPARERFSESRWFAMQQAIVDDQLVFKKTGTSLSDSIYDITRQAEKGLKSQIGTAVIMGGSLISIGAIINNLLTRPAKDIRIEAGKDMVLAQAAKVAQVTPGYSASAFTNLNALTIVKTQSSFNAGIINYANAKSAVMGYISRVHSNNPCDYCASIDGKYFPKGEEPDPQYHYGCMCTLDLAYKEAAEAQMATEDQMKGLEYWKSKNVA